LDESANLAFKLISLSHTGKKEPLEKEVALKGENSLSLK
jgi:hypothetical protein